MAEPFPVSGTIDPAAFPHLLVDLHRHGATGSLKVSGPTHPKALYFRGGRILFGSSNDPKDQLGPILLESGRITKQQLDEVSAKVGPGRPLAKVLSESGFVNQRELGEAARVKLERILADVLSWQSGSFEFEDGVLPKGAVDLKLSTEKLLLTAVQRIPDRSFALRHLSLEDVLEPIPGTEATLADIHADVQPLLERLDGRRSLREAVALTRLDEFEAAKTACALLFLQAIRQHVEPVEVDLAEEAQSGFGGAEAAAVTMRVPLEDEPEPFVVSETHPPIAFGAEPEVAETIIEPPPSRPTFVEAQAVEPEPDQEPLEVAEVSRDLPPEAPTFIMGASPVAEAAPPPRAAAPPWPAPTPPESSSPWQTPPPPAPWQPPSASGSRLPLVPPPPRQPSAPPGPAFELPVEQPSPSFPDLAPPAPPPSRPSQADLAALDALLNPSGKPSPGHELSFGAKTTEPPLLRGAGRGAGSRKTSVRLEPAGVSTARIPLIVTAVVGVVAATGAAWYFLLHKPQPVGGGRVGTTQTLPTPAATLPPVSTTVPQPSPTAQPTPEGAVSPTPTEVPPTTLAPSPTPAPTARPTPTPTPGGTGGAATVAEARRLLATGSLSDAARAFTAALRPEASRRFTVQALTACVPETVQKAIAGTGQAQELFVLDVNLQGRRCYRVCWGLYDSRPAAEAAILPSYFRQPGIRPRVSGLAELLP